MVVSNNIKFYDFVVLHLAQFLIESQFTKNLISANSNFSTSTNNLDSYVNKFNSICVSLFNLHGNVILSEALSVFINYFFISL